MNGAYFDFHVWTEVRGDEGRRVKRLANLFAPAEHVGLAFPLTGLAERGLRVDTECEISRMPRASASKKTAIASEQDRPDIARKCKRWKAHQGGLTCNDLYSLMRLGPDGLQGASA